MLEHSYHAVSFLCFIRDRILYVDIFITFDFMCLLGIKAIMIYIC
jgi:hypothetical protein